MASSSSPRARVRSVLPNLFLGFHQPGPKNSITDIPGVLVSTQSIHKPLGYDPSKPYSAINTGATVILPRKEWFGMACHAGIHRFNGSGEMTGSHWIEEVGTLNSPIVITNSFSVGAAYTGIYQHSIREHADKKTALTDWFLLPVVAETFDGYLNDISAMVVTPEMIVEGIDTANSEPVKEGNTGGGTGMTCMGFKSGTGSASRVLDGFIRGEPTKFTVGVLTQVNFGKARDLRFGSVPVGRILAAEKEAKQAGKPDEAQEKLKDGSIIVIIATDCPLHPAQLKRLAQRATVGIARTGGWGANSSGDIFLAFSTANYINLESPPLNGIDPKKAIFIPTVNAESKINAIEDSTINGVFEAVADATEEAILNSLCMAETTDGPDGRRTEAIDLDLLKRIVDEHGGGR